jgi:hypothetical protein
LSASSILILMSIVFKVGLIVTSFDTALTPRRDLTALAASSFWYCHSAVP